ncbi:MAG: class I SAM-dependent methyltransferase [Nitrospirae bacterium]|nr:MAG: class I SAM-dependent methyltransferase [Nitrospirota bacterium]
MDPHRAHWEERYRETPAEALPWFYPGLDPDIEAALGELALRQGRLLDLGCGPGTQAIELARRGFAVTASDVAEAALAGARARAAAAGVAVRFVRDDILATRLTGPFEVVLDRGCFHVLPRERFGDYAAAVHRLLAPGGWLLLKCFSHEEQRPEGPPNRLAPEAIRATFEGRFRVERIDRTHFPARGDEPPPRALFCRLARI